MYNTKFTNILNEQHGIIVHGVNCKGVMGAGIALQIKNMYPSVYFDYYSKYMDTSNPSTLLGSTVSTIINKDLIIVSGFTQETYGGDKRIIYANYNAIKSVFKNVNTLAQNTGLPVLYPLIGAGRANGDWRVISDIIDLTLSPDVTRTLFRFYG